MPQRTFLDRLSDEERAALKKQMVIRQHKNKSEIISHEEDARDVYFVLEGMARAKINSEGGKDVDFRDIHKGEIFGELAAIDNLPRSASVEAVGDTKCGSLSPRQFKELVETTPSFTWALLGHLSQQSRTMTERIYEYSTMLVSTRLIREFIRLAEPGQDENSAEISPAPSQTDLKSRISTHREAVSREMSRLRQIGLIEYSPKKISLLNLEGLRAECQIVDR
ncbi:MAG: Crp/Fnr family transcriptional regulator [Pseudomonadota bacterium]